MNDMMMTEAAILKSYHQCNAAYYNGKKPTPSCVVFCDVKTPKLETVRIFSAEHAADDSVFELVVPRIWLKPLAGTMMTLLITRFLSTLN